MTNEELTTANEELIASINELQEEVAEIKAHIEAEKEVEDEREWDKTYWRRNEIESLCRPLLNVLQKQFNQLQNQMNEYGKGVQNVYNEMHNLRLDLRKMDFDKAIDYSKSLAFEEFVQKFNKVKAFMESGSVRQVLDDFETFRYEITELLGKELK